MKRVLWRPDPQWAASSAMAAFSRFCARETRQDRLSGSYDALHRFSIESAETFWPLLLRFSQIPFSGQPEPVWESAASLDETRFFPDVTLSWPEVLLSEHVAPDSAPAICSIVEGGSTTITRGELRERVLDVAGALMSLGLEPQHSGDLPRAAALVPNQLCAVEACLAVTACGATWSSVAPDMGLGAVLSRLEQLQPRILLTVTSWTNQGQTNDLGFTIARLAGELKSLQAIVLLDDGVIPETGIPTYRLNELRGRSPLDAFPRYPFNHPLFVMFSSGTTGPPKCIVHGHGGTALEHFKELSLHSDVRATDRLYFHTSTAWMMWNWLVSGLCTGAEVILYDGAVAWPDKNQLLQVVAGRDITHFGTSPTYLRYVHDMKLDVPAFRRLRAVMSTGAVLHAEQYDQAQAAFGDVAIQSVSGGTDIIGCFVLGAPTLPVYRGESQCISLGYDVRVLDDDEQITRAGRGELVCCQPFVSCPVGLMHDPDRSRFRAAYFGEARGVWQHGDFIELTDQGTARVLGRCDGVLNVGGNRIGPAEIYSVVETFAPVRAAMAVDQAWPRAITGRRLVLLLVLEAGVELDRKLTLQLKKALRDRASQNHVPNVVVQVDDLPTTFSGKRSERAVSDILNGRPVRNRAAIRNPETLDRLLSDHPDLRG